MVWSCRAELAFLVTPAVNSAALITTASLPTQLGPGPCFTRKPFLHAREGTSVASNTAPTETRRKAATHEGKHHSDFFLASEAFERQDVAVDSFWVHMQLYVTVAMASSIGALGTLISQGSELSLRMLQVGLS